MKVKELLKVLQGLPEDLWKLQLILSIMWCLAFVAGLIYLCANYLPVLVGVSFVIIVYGTFWSIGTIRYWLDRL